MLGCQDFCGYYDWTFHHVRQRFGQDAVLTLWAGAIGGESQRHYRDNGAADGLRGLYRTWVKTGEDECCDWKFTLDEARNVLRWDMYECPSKGFLLSNDLHADEDYCDHCMGWVVPLLAEIGVEVSGHEHNHYGQCWAELTLKDRPRQPLDVERDIRDDERWGRGFIERWEHGVKLPVLSAVSKSATAEDVIRAWLGRVAHLVVLGRGPSAHDDWVGALPRDGVLITDPTYVQRDVFAEDPLAVMIGDNPPDLEALATRFHDTPPQRRPLLLHAYLPAAPRQDFAAFDLPRPLPILPLLIRAGLYTHEPGAPYPTSGTFLTMVALACGERVSVAGVDLYSHPSAKVYAAADAPPELWPARHSYACDRDHLARALRRSGAAVRLTAHLQGLLSDADAAPS